MNIQGKPDFYSDDKHVNQCGRELPTRGKQRLSQARSDMPVLDSIAKRLKRDESLKGLSIIACLHISAETTNFVQLLSECGATINLVSCNPLSIKDEFLDVLETDKNVNLFCFSGMDNYYRNIENALNQEFGIVVDDGGDLIATLHKKNSDRLEYVLGATEQTTNGVNRLRAMERLGELKIPVYAVNDAPIKNMFDNKFGTGQSTIDGLLRATNLLLAGKITVVCGYGWCGKGLARTFSGMGAHVIITEICPIKALEASLDGYRVNSLAEVADQADIIITATGSINVIRSEHLSKMKSGVLLINAGHFDCEIDLKSLKKLATRSEMENQYLDKFIFPDGRFVRLMCQGRLTNIVSGEGNPASVMDLSFSCQALAIESIVCDHKKLPNKVMAIPETFDFYIAQQKLIACGISIDRATDEQVRYFDSWKLGT